MSNRDKLINKWLHYFDIYERHLEKYRDKSPVMLEIGVQSGGSLQMWREYFGAGCKIIGLDIDPNCKQHESSNIEIFIGSQDDPRVIDLIFSKYPEIDILLDDGSHKMNHMISSFELIYERLKEEGIYIVEDMQSCYDLNFGGGLNEKGTFMEFAKRKLDEINFGYLFEDIPSSSAEIFTKNSGHPATKITCSTDRISFYSGMIIFERQRQSVKNCCLTYGIKEGDKRIVKSFTRKITE